jgi:hypothetical protein
MRRLYKVGYVPFWVSCSTGLPASVLAFLELLNSLTSFLNREEGDSTVVVGCVSLYAGMGCEEYLYLKK